MIEMKPNDKKNKVSLNFSHTKKSFVFMQSLPLSVYENFLKKKGLEYSGIQEYVRFLIINDLKNTKQ